MLRGHSLSWWGMEGSLLGAVEPVVAVVAEDDKQRAQMNWALAPAQSIPLVGIYITNWGCSSLWEIVHIQAGTALGMWKARQLSSPASDGGRSLA